MKETGIIMSGDHPKLILDLKKTMTRRVIIPQPIGRPYWGDGTTDSIRGGKIIGEPGYYDGGFPHHKYIKCPYGQAGDRLWVRETWATERKIDRFSPTYIGNAGAVPLFYKADSPIRTLLEVGKWRSPRFMPCWASRITLEITALRVERLQEITEEDAIAEGFKANEHQTWWQGYRELDLNELGTELMHQQSTGDKPPDWMIEPHRMLDRPDIEAIFSARNRFRAKWDSLNAKRGYSWESNPWVWVISFRRINDN